jgi:predicted nuclease of predicted toxin-antitoxin system
MGSASDEEVWAYARANDCTIVTKDADFSDFSVMRGFPPKVVWLRRGNCTTRQIEMMMRTHAEAIEALSADATAGLLALI